MLPSEVFWGVIGVVFVRSSANSASTSSRSSVNGVVCCRLFVRVKVAARRPARSISNESCSKLSFSPRGFLEEFDFVFSITRGMGGSESEVDPGF